MSKVLDFFSYIYAKGVEFYQLHPVTAVLTFIAILAILVSVLFYRKKTIDACKKIYEFMRSVRSEWFKIVWPTRAEVVRATIMILVFSGLAALFFFVIDSALNAIVGWIFG
jgi:preprotein translocase subunit SecE